MSEKFDMHCVVELFGHSRISGRVTEKAIGGATFVRVDVPKTRKRAGFTRFYGASAIYSITPVDEKIAGLMAEQLEVEPVSEWTLSLALRDKLIPATTGPVPDHEDWDSSMEWSALRATHDEPDEAEDPMLDALPATLDDEPDLDEDAPTDPEEEAEAKAYYRRVDDKRAAAEWARELLKGEFIIVDTETTGFGEEDEIVQIGIVDRTGAVVLDQLIKPDQPILNSQYHGITDETVKDAPGFPEAFRAIKTAMQGKKLVAYNLAYDARMINQVCRKYELPEWGSDGECVMEMFAQFNGEWNEHHGNYRWKKLREAMATFGLEFEGQEHNAVADCKATLAVIRKMAEYGATPATADEDRGGNTVVVEGVEG